MLAAADQDVTVVIHTRGVTEVANAYRSEFLLALREVAAQEKGRDSSAPDLVVCAPYGQRDVVVLYREYDAGPVLGRRYDLQAHAALFGKGPSPRFLAETVFWNELWDPTGRGEVLEVDWADGLGVERRHIQWVGAAEWLQT